jgi:hypothetical protein
MSLERKDIRAYLAPDIHQAVTRRCNRLGITVADFIERVVTEEVVRIGHEAIASADDFRDIGFFRRGRESAVSPMSRAAARIQKGLPPGARR